MHEDQFYNRQNLIPGWDQKKLNDTNVVVTGSGILAQQALINLAGLGIENLYLISNERITPDCNDNYVYDKPKYSDYSDFKVDRIANFLSRLNENLNIKVRHGKFAKAHLRHFDADIIIDTINESLHKEELFDYAKNKKILHISACSDPDNSKVAVGKDIEGIIESCFEGRRQGIFSSGVAAGIIGDEVRKSRVSFGDSNLKRIFYYNINSSERNSPSDDLRRIPFKILRDYKALVVGAGAIGNPLVNTLSLMGFGRVDIIDGDDIERPNLSKQFNFASNIGKNKSEILSGVVGRISSLTKSDFFPRYLDESDSRLVSGYDVIFGCVDNIPVRKLLNSFSVAYKVPYIDGGCSYTSGQCKIYLPGISRCLDCQSDYDNMIENLEKKKRTTPELLAQGCSPVTPSVIVPNFIISNAMAGEAMRYFLSDDPLQGSLVYNCFRKDRIGVTDMRYRKDCGRCGG